ncbi:hypothetical protein WJX73_009998 [Symbiochloris irregularis]|uniref:DEAD box protein 1 n=1 Tax=Symbiochloris irregularis TaxID=706552 RepID=A0AAW1NQP2_9CHLO
MSAFEEAGVMPELIRAVEQMGWTLPTPVQAEAVPLILGGGDVMAAAETGSGKTGAFALPILQIVYETVTTSPAQTSSAQQSSAPAASLECKLSLDDRDSLLAISPDGLTCQARSQHAWQGGRATAGVREGRAYFEATVADEGLCRIGWASQAAGLDLGTNQHSFGYGGTGKKSHNKRFEDYGMPYGRGDVVGCLLDCDHGCISFTLNGSDLGIAFDLPKHLHKQALYPAVCLKNAELTINFGDSAFKFGPPHGFTGLSKLKSGQLVSADMGSQEQAGSSSSSQGPTALILEPARELAEQVHNAVIDMGRYLPRKMRTVLVTGGVNPKAQEKALRDGVDIVTGTPAHILKMVQSGKLALGSIKFLVLDEADRLMEPGNDGDTIYDLFSRLPKGGAGVARLQVLLFSATLHSVEVTHCAERLCQNPVLIDLKGKDAVPEAVDHVDTPDNWSEAVKRLKPRLLQRLIDYFRMEQCMIFCRTNFDCDNLEHFLNSLHGGTGAPFRGKRESGKENPYSCVVLAGKRSVEQRREALQAFKDGDVRLLICTDVAARGIDISGLPFMVNMTLPDKSEDYIHRVGRVGRQGVLGLAVSLVSTVPEKVWYCTVKGYTPWVNPKPGDKRTREEGGHTIWYEEPQLIKDIETRIRAPVEPLAPDMALPPSMAKAREASGGTSSAYGQAKSGEQNKEMHAHMEALRPAVAELARLEALAQQSFLGFRHRWTAHAAANG